VLAYRNRDTLVVAVSLVALAILPVVVLLVLLGTYSGAKGPPLSIRHAVPKDAEVLSYITTYLIPFFELDLSKATDLVTLLVFLTVLGIVYVNSSMILVNPVLSLRGYRAWSVTDSGGHEFMLVTTRRPKPGDVREPIKVGDYLRLEVKWRHSKT
jgi:hypothetical protein